jgi:hypothetical protein
LDELAHRRTVLEETRSRLSGLLTETLGEVGPTPIPGDEPATSREAPGIRAVEASAHPDRERIA